MAKTPTKRKQLESRFGCRYSVVLRLPYFDVVRMHVIDPMHSFFLGTARKVTKHWRKKYFKKKDLIEIQSKIDKFVAPVSVGRIPHKIASGFAHLTADQFRLWVTVYSTVVLKGMISEEEMNCWQNFVLACNIIYSKSVRKTNVEKMDTYLLRFSKGAQKLYGNNFITPNMHMNCHIADCIYDFGPVYAFWLYSFERYNGLLGAIKTNNKNIEEQIMNTFTRNSYAKNQTMNPDVINPNDAVVLDLFDTLYVSTPRGTLQSINCPDLFSLSRMAYIDFPLVNADWSNINHYVYKVSCDYLLTNTQTTHITEMYSELYPEMLNVENSVVHRSIRKLNFVKLDSLLFAPFSSRNKRSSYILAHWYSFQLRPGRIESIYLHNITCSGVAKMHIVLEVKWYHAVSENIKNYYGNPVSCWNPLFEDPGSKSFLPVQRVKGKFVHCFQNIHNVNAIVVCPISRNI